MIFDLTTILGIIGSILILVAFILEQTEVWNSEMLRYDFVNLIGSAILVYYGFLIHGYPFVILNSIWALVSLRDLVLDILRNKK